MSLLSKKNHKIAKGSSLYMFHSAVGYPPFDTHILKFVKKNLETNEDIALDQNSENEHLDVSKHNVEEFRDSVILGKPSDRLTTIKFKSIGNYKLTVKTMDNKEELIEVLCV
jgi:predicted  nucleic acid-binding Zn-ribbon protein